MPHSTRTPLGAAAQAFNSCPSPPKGCVSLPIAGSKSYPQRTIASVERTSSSGNDRGPVLYTYELDTQHPGKQSTSKVPTIDIDPSSMEKSNTRRRSPRFPSTNPEVAEPQPIAGPSTAILMNKFYGAHSTTTKRTYPAPISTKPNSESIDAPPSRDPSPIQSKSTPQSELTLLVEVQIGTNAEPRKTRSSNTQGKKSSLVVIPTNIRRSARKNYIPLGPRHLEFEYHDACQELREATLRAIVDMGWDPKKVKAGRPVSRVTQPTVEEIMSLEIPAVVRARKRVDDADVRLNDALARGFTWEITPLPQYEVVEDEEGNILDVYMIEDPLDPSFRPRGDRVGKRKYEEEAEEGHGQTKRRAMKT